MLYSKEIRKIAELEGITISEFDRKLGSNKSVQVSMSVAKNGLVGERVSRKIVRAFPSSTALVVGVSKKNDMLKENFLSLDELGELVCILNKSIDQISLDIGKSKKFLWVTIVNQKGLSAKLTRELYTVFPEEVEFVVGESKTDILLRYK